MFNFWFMRYFFVFFVLAYGFFAMAHHFSDPYLELCASIRRLSRGTIPLNIFVSGLSNKQRTMVFGLYIDDEQLAVKVPGKSRIQLTGPSGQDAIVGEYFAGHAVMAYYYWKEVLSEKEFTTLGWEKPTEDAIHKKGDSEEAVQARLRKNLTKIIVDKNKGCF